MTEEIEAHVLKKYEILQKLGKLIPRPFSKVAPRYYCRWPPYVTSGD